MKNGRQLGITIWVGLGMVLLGNHLLRRRFLGAQLLVEPDQGGQDRRSLVTEPLDKLHGERTVQRGVTQAPQNVVGVPSRRIAQTQQTVRQLVHAPCKLGAGSDSRSARAGKQRVRPTTRAHPLSLCV